MLSLTCGTTGDDLVRRLPGQTPWLGGLHVPMYLLHRTENLSFITSVERRIT